MDAHEEIQTLLDGLIGSIRKAKEEEESLWKELTDDQKLSGFGKKNSTISQYFPKSVRSSTFLEHFDAITQIEVLQQKKNDSCGYFALFNLTNSLLAAISPSEEDSQRFIHLTGDRTYFWMRLVFVQQSTFSNSL
jgi:hypothetical protein